MMKGLIKNLLPYGLVCKWQSVRYGISIDRPLFYYPGFGKRLKRIVKFCLPYGLVIPYRECAYRRVHVNSVPVGTTVSHASEVTIDGPVVIKLPPLPSEKELMPSVRTRRIIGIKGLRQPDVTVVTVVFNIVKAGRSKSFLQCLDSVQAQTGVTVEHLIVDGASKDGTLELLDGYENTHHTTCVFSAPDKGIYDAMNRGLALAKGRYVTFLNSDDFYNDPLGLRDSVARLDETKAEFSYSPVVMIGEDGKPMEHPNSNPDVNRLCYVMAFSHQSVVMRTESFRALGGFDTSYRSAADYDSVLRMVFAGYHAARVERPYVTFRAGGYSWANMTESQAECGRMFSNLYGKCLGYPLTPEEGREMYVTMHAPTRLADLMLNRVMTTFGMEGERALPRRRIGVFDRWNVIGLYEAEGWGAWGGRDVRIYATLPVALRGRDLRLSFHIGGFFDASHAAIATIRCNGRELHVLQLTSFLPSRIDIGCPADVAADGNLVLDVETTFAARPAGDTRILGISFSQLSISAIDEQEGRTQ